MAPRGRLGPNTAPPSEAEEQQWIVRLARTTLGYEVRHVPNYRVGGRHSNGSATGLLDLFLVRASRFIHAEVKGVTAEVNHEQAKWMQACVACLGVEVYVWRAGRTSRQQISDVLAPKRRRGGNSVPECVACGHVAWGHVWEPNGRKVTTWRCRCGCGVNEAMYAGWLEARA